MKIQNILLIVIYLMIYFIINKSNTKPADIPKDIPKNFIPSLKLFIKPEQVIPIIIELLLS